MANNNKKYVSLSKLSTFLDNLKGVFASLSHTHKVADLTDYTVDSALSSASTNPVQNAVLNEEFESIAIAMNALDLAIDGKADSTHNHDSDYADINHNHDDVYSLADHHHDSKYDAKGAASSTVSTHNTSTSAHNDIRDLITGLTNRLNALANSDDTTLDQLSEIVEYIKNNKSLIDSITTNKVNVSDIVNNLTTNVVNKPLSASQGVVIKELIDTLQEELDGHTHAVADITDLTATATELNYMDGVTSNVQTQLNDKLSLDGGTLTGNLKIAKANSPTFELAASNNNGYTSIDQHGGILTITSGMAKGSDIGCIQLNKPDGDLTTLAQLRTKIGGVYRNYKLYGEHNKPTAADIGVYSKADHDWTLIYDSGEIPDIVNAISGIDVSGYTNFEVLIRCYNDGDSHTTRTGSAIFTAQNGKLYQFPVWTNMFSKSISTVHAMAQFKLVDGWLVCPCASSITSSSVDIFDSAEGGTAGNLVPTGSGMMKCTSPLSTLTISNLDQNSNFYFGSGSRVMVWGWKA